MDFGEFNMSDCDDFEPLELAIITLSRVVKLIPDIQLASHSLRRTANNISNSNESMSNRLECYIADNEVLKKEINKYINSNLTRKAHESMDDVIMSLKMNKCNYGGPFGHGDVKILPETNKCDNEGKEGTVLYDGEFLIGTDYSSFLTRELDEFIKPYRTFNEVIFNMEKVIESVKNKQESLKSKQDSVKNKQGE